MKNSLRTLKFSFCHGLGRLYLGNWLQERKKNAENLRLHRDIESPIYSYSVENHLDFLIKLSFKLKGMKLLELWIQFSFLQGQSFSKWRCLYNVQPQGRYPRLMDMNLWECGLGIYIFNSIHRGGLYTYDWRKHCLLRLLYIDLVGRSWL